MTRRRLLPLLAASLPAVTSATTSADTDINALLEPIRTTRKVPALIGGIVTISGLSAAGVTGVRKRDDSTPATLSDLWHLGSMTKAMTATLIATWVQSGKLNWDDPISKFLAPLLKDASPEFSAITVRSEGPVSPVSGENRLHDAVVAALRHCRATRKVKLPFRWKRNGLRHAFCSYRLSVTQDLNRVALEAGNSPAMIHAHYKELVPAADALAWFNTLPPENPASGKVIPLPALAA